MTFTLKRKMVHYMDGGALVYFTITMSSWLENMLICIRIASSHHTIHDDYCDAVPSAKVVKYHNSASTRVFPQMLIESQTD